MMSFIAPRLDSSGRECPHSFHSAGRLSQSLYARASSFRSGRSCLHARPFLLHPDQDIGDDPCAHGFARPNLYAHLSHRNLSMRALRIPCARYAAAYERDDLCGCRAFCHYGGRSPHALYLLGTGLAWLCWDSFGRAAQKPHGIRDCAISSFK